MARDLRLSVSGDSSSGQKALDKLAAEADKAAKQVQSMAAKADVAAVKARKLAEAEERAADKTRDLAAKAAALRKQIEESGDATGTLGKRLDRLTRDTKSAALATDDYRRAADRASHEAREQAREYDRVAANANQAARAVARLGAVSALSPDGKSGGGGKGGSLGASILASLPGFVTELLGTGAKAGGAAAGAAGSAASSLGPYGTAIGIGAGALAALAAGPFIGGVVGGGALLGGAAGGAGLGLSAAWMANPDRFGKQWDTTLDHLKQRFASVGLDFGDELEDSLREVDRVIRDLPLERISAVSKDFVGPLVQGAGGGITAAADGFADFLEAAKPVVDTVGPKLADLGRDVGDALRAIGLGADGGALALGDLVDAIGYVVKATGILVMGLEKAYEAERNFVTKSYDLATSMPVTGKVIEYVGDKLTHIASTAPVAGRALDGAKVSTDGLAASQRALSIELQKASDALGAQLGSLLALDQANDAAATGTDRLKEAFRQNGYELDGNSKKAQANREVLQGVIGDYIRQRDAAVAAGDGTGVSIGKANAVLRQHLEELRAILVAHGEDTSAVDRYLEKLDSLDGRVVTVKVDVKYQEYNPGIALGNLLHHARGGDIPFAGASVVGEHGPEIAWLNRGQYVSTAEETRKLTSMVGSAGGGAVGGQLTMRVAPGADSLFGQMMQYAFDRGWVQVFAGSTLVSARSG